MKGIKIRKPRKVIILGAMIVVFILLMIAIKTEESKEMMTYNEVMKALESDSISVIKLKGTAGKVLICMKDGTQKTTQMVDNSEFIKVVSQKIEEGSKVKIEIMENSDLFPGPMLFMIISYGFLFWLMRKQTGGEKFDVGRHQAKETFQDVAGIEECQEQIQDVIDYLRNPKKYADMGAKMPKGILLSGEPGNGKTLLARAMSGEAGVNFFQVTGSSFEERLVGVGASRVRKLFDEAKRNAPAIIFIDEIDSIARSRYSDNSNNEQTLNQLLAEMDGFENNDKIVVVAATNHMEVLDEAILRPGRFDRRIYIPNPDIRARKLILELHARDKIVSSEVSFEEIAQKTVGFSGADLRNVLNEAAIYAVKKGKKCITNEAIEEAIAIVIVGLKKKYSVMLPEEKHRVAIHEASHAVVSAIVRPEVKNFCISIVPRGKAGGYNFFDEKGRNYKVKKEFLKQIQVLYAGGIAEDIILNGISNGASNDFEKASKIALQMVSKYGMGSSFLVKVRNENEYNKLLDAKAIREVEKICKGAELQTRGIVVEHFSQICKLASILEEKEYLDKEEVEKFISCNL